MAAGDWKARAEVFGIETHEVDGQDVMAVCQLGESLVTRTRKGDGPFFILLDTYRYHGHHVGDVNRSYYRSKDEERHWKNERDPIIKLAEHMISKKWATQTQLDAISSEIKAEAKAAVDYAISAPYPSGDEVGMHVYAATRD